MEVTGMYINSRARLVLVLRSNIIKNGRQTSSNIYIYIYIYNNNNKIRVESEHYSE